MMSRSPWRSGGRVALLVALLGGVVAPAVAGDFAPDRHAGARALVETLTQRGLPRDWLAAALEEAERRPAVLEAMAGAVERRLRWDEYRAIFLTEARITQGAAFLAEHAAAFARAEERFGVPSEVIAAIIGVETAYGRHMGRHRVLDSLATLAFEHPRRGAFFLGELSAFLEITHEQGVAPGSLKGSYAGAMGYPQFIPTSYQAYAVDFDGDERRDLWHNPVDAIGSVGNYLAEHGWQRGAPLYHEADGPPTLPESIAFNRTVPPATPLATLAAAGVTAPAALTEETAVMPLALEVAEGRWRYRVGHQNFYVITRYNHSHLYAMAVSELAEAIAARQDAESREARQ